MGFKPAVKTFGEADVVVTTPRRDVRITVDSDPINPRAEYSNAGVMYCRHGRYDLGDKNAEDAFVENAKGNRVQRDDIALALPIYMYDHSGITISHEPFSCPWDSGLLGVHYITKEVLSREFNGDKAKARACLESELKTYDQYLRGEVFGFEVLDENDDAVDSCWGFFGDKLEETGILEYLPAELHEQAKEAWERRYEG